MTHAERASSFGRRADLYDRLRPDYPAAAIDAVLPADARLVVDVGAGTGKLSAGLCRRGLQVIAIEPDPAMRAVLAARLPDVQLYEGVGEQLPIADGAVDAVLYGQAWHWTRSDDAAADARRVLTASGVLGILQNLHDDRIDWVAQLMQLTASEAALSSATNPSALPGFRPGRRQDIVWQQVLSKADVVDLVSTWSTVATRSATEQAEVRRHVRDLLASTPQLHDLSTIALPLVCHCWIYQAGPSAKSPVR